MNATSGVNIDDEMAHLLALQNAYSANARVMSSIKQMYDLLLQASEASMSIDGVSGKTSYIGPAIVNLRDQLDDLTTQLASGKISTTYAGQGTDRGFALNLRAQVSEHRCLRRHRQQRQHPSQRGQSGAAGTDRHR